MVCPNCTGEKEKENEKEKGKENGKEKTTGAKQGPTSKCNHGPNAACQNCRPALQEDLASPSYRCRNHGPNGSCIECIEREDRLKMRLKLQDAPHCTQVVVDYHAANVYQSYLHEKRYQLQRCGFLFGRENDDGSTTVEAIYEPPQKSEKEKATLLPDPDDDRVETIASLLGLKRVGWIFSHPSRKYVMSSAEVQKTAEFQSKYGDRFVTLILSINEKGQGNLEAFQVSDQAVKLHQTNNFVPSDDPSKLQFRTPVYVEGAQTTVADYHFFLVTVPVRSKDKGFLTNTFPVENRERAQARSDLKVHLMHHAKLSFVEQVADFHLLIFLSKGIFDLNTDFPTLCEAVRTKKAQNLEGFKMILESYVA